jgi:isopenicillin-N N-acyltransferase-like protein
MLHKIIMVISRLYTILFIALFITSCSEKSGDTNNPTQEKLIINEGVKDSIRVIKLTGTNYEMGLQHGRQLKTEIHDLVELWEKDIELNYQIPSEEFISKFLESTNYVQAIKKWTPNLFEEIKGISEGSEIDINKIIVFQLVDEMWNNGGVVFKAHHCSSIGVANRNNNGSTNYIAQNVDVTPFYHKNKILLSFNNPLNNLSTYVLTVPGIIGVNGINETIGITVNSLMDLQNSSDGLPVCCVVRGALNQNTFEQAANFINEIKHASGQNYIIGSKSDVASFECSSIKVSKYWPDSVKRYTFHANNALINDSYQPSYIQYLEDSLQMTHKEYIKDIPRLESLRKRILNQGSIDLNILKQTLRSKDSKTDPICNDYTWVSTIMEFHEDYNVLLVSPGKPDATEYVKFRIE